MYTTELLQDRDQPQGLLAEGINRAYIHEGALGQWAIASSADATEVLWFMGAQRFSRVVGNILGPGGDLENAWEGDTTLQEIISTLLASDERRYIEPFFTHAGVSIISMDAEGASTSRSPVTERFVPIGGPLNASCFDQDYHTYGFNGIGTRKMRGEEGLMADLATEVATGGQPDLALVNGPNGDVVRGGKGVYEFNMDAVTQGSKIAGDYLVPVERDIGPGGVMVYLRQARPEKPIALREALEIDRVTRAGIVQTADIRVRMVSGIVDRQRTAIGSKRHKGRMEQIECVSREITRVIGRHRLIREEFYPTG
jgi:hypothetical protein